MRLRGSMKNLIALLVLLSLSACSSVPTATPAPTVDVAAVQTRAVLDAFATQTASVPTATLAATVDVAAIQTQAALSVLATQAASVPTETNTPEPTQTPIIITATPSLSPVVVVVTATPQPTALPKPTPLQASQSASPTPTLEPWLALCRANLQEGMGEMVFSNYMGEKEMIVIIGKNKYVAAPLSDTPIPLPAGNVEVNFVAPGWGPNWNWVDKLVIEAGKCYHDWVYYTRS